MPIFSNIQDFKKYVGGAVNATFSLNNIEASIYDAAYNHIMPHTGRELWDKITGDSNAPLAANDPLFPYVKRAVARLALYEYVPEGAVMLSDIGLMEAVSENQNTAGMAAQNAYRNAQLIKGYNAIEEMLYFLNKNKANYASWTASEGYTRYNELFLRSAAQMKLHYGADTNRFTYEVLRSIVRDVEYFAIENWLPKAFLVRLRSVIEANATTYEREVINMLLAAITNFAVEEGIKRHWVRVAEGSILHIDGWRQLKENTNVAAVKLKMTHLELSGNRHISRLKAYLWANKAQFPTCFATTEGGTNDIDGWVSDTTTAAETAEIKKKQVIFSLN